MLDVPDAVRAKARAAGAETWLADLPDLVAGIVAEWDLTLGDAYADGTEAFVTRVETADGTPAVLKLMVPRGTDDAALEIAVLRLADGDGCARLLRDDASRGALLLERLGPSLYELGLPFERCLPILCDTASRVWRPVDGVRLTTGAEKAAWLIDAVQRLWEELDHPCSERSVAHAVACAERRGAAHDDERSVLVHGDVHRWNALLAHDGSFRLVDPDGLLAEPEYDLGVLMREDAVELLRHGPMARAKWLADRTGLDVTAIWEWGVVERVSTALVCTQLGLEPVASEMVLAADVVAAL